MTEGKSGKQGTRETAQQEFEALLEPMGPGGAWTCLRVPFDVEEVFGSKARTAVEGSINGFRFRSSVFPTGEGEHFMMVNKTMQKGANVNAGDRVSVTLRKDTAPRVIETPQDLENAFAGDAQASEGYERLPYSYKKEYVDWIESAKREETRARRIGKALDMLAEGKRLK